MDVFPQTPQAEVVRKDRRAAGDTVTPGARATSTMLPISPSAWSRCPQVVPSQTFMPAMSSAAATIASPTRNPAASSMSSPGVRMVMVSAAPSTRMPSGSSPASRSARAVADTKPAGESVTRTTRRRAVRPDNVPPLARLPPFQRTPAGWPQRVTGPGRAAGSRPRALSSAAVRAVGRGGRQRSSPRRYAVPDAAFLITISWASRVPLVDRAAGEHRLAGRERALGRALAVVADDRGAGEVPDPGGAVVRADHDVAAWPPT